MITLSAEEKAERCAQHLEHCEGPLTAYVLIARAATTVETMTWERNANDYWSPNVVAEALFIALGRNGYLSSAGVDCTGIAPDHRDI
jgi:hypothetical protein